MLTAFFNAPIFTGKEKISGKALITRNDIIDGLVAIDAIPENANRIDCSNCFIAPGLIDLQIYGAGKYLFSNKPTVTALRSMVDSLLDSGTTSFFPTLATNSMEVFREAINVVKEISHPAVMGLHFEGPYINPLKRGAHILEYIKEPEKKEVEELLKEAEGVLKMMTVAPEVCTPEIIRLLKDNGVAVSAGHSNATFNEAMDGFKNGITATTHLFNAMSPFHHRETGLPGATFCSKDIFASIIADGVHVDFNTLMISKKIMNEKLFLITDAVAEANDGNYIHVKKEDRFTLPDGTLSGSCLTLLRAVQNCVEKAGIALDEALRMASTYPAQLINNYRIGRIEPGYKANLLVFTKDFKVKHVVTEGRIFNGR